MVADEAPQPESTSTEIAPVVKNNGGKIIADSRDVANTFHKDHRHVLRDIRKIIEKDDSLGSKFGPFTIQGLNWGKHVALRDGPRRLLASGDGLHRRAYSLPGVHNLIEKAPRGEDRTGQKRAPWWEDCSHNCSLKLSQPKRN
jgi:hypothetical protein